MKIPSIKNFTCFKGATVNINALSDIHGRIELADGAYQTLINTKEDSFVKEEKGKKNYLVIGGDWFISGNQKGYASSPNKPLMKFQGEFLNKFISQIKEKYPQTSALFIPGNHEFDGGVDLFLDEIKTTDASFIATNLDFNNSKKAQALIKEGRLISSRIDYIEDDKDKTKTHAVLNLGVAPVNLEYYLKNHEGINFLDDTFVPQKFITPNQYQNSKLAVKEEIETFKKSNPNGVVILTCHTGVGFADACAKTFDIDLIFDGHEHKDETRYVRKTPIVTLSQNFNKIVNAKIKIDDEGLVESITTKSLRPNNSKNMPGKLAAYYNEMFKKDIEKAYTIKSADDRIEKLDIAGARYKNNNLANFVTDAILTKIKEKDPTVEIFALNSSSLRGGFNLKESPNVSNIDILSCLNGITRNQADIYVTEVSGQELLKMVLDNFLFNEIDPEKNTIIQYSGLKINKTELMKAYRSKEDLSELYKYIELSETGKTVNPNKTYKIANPEKYFIKARTKEIQDLKNKSTPLGANVLDLFSDFFKNKSEIEFTPDVRLF